MASKFDAKRIYMLASKWGRRPCRVFCFCDPARLWWETPLPKNLNNVLRKIRNLRPHLLWEGSENRKTYPKQLFIRAFTYFRPGVRPNQARSSQNTCSLLGRGIFIDPFFFSSGVSFEFFTMLSFICRRKNQQGILIYIYTWYRRFSRKNCLSFRCIASGPE